MKIILNIAKKCVTFIVYNQEETTKKKMYATCRIHILQHDACLHADWLAVAVTEQCRNKKEDKEVVTHMHKFHIQFPTRLAMFSNIFFGKTYHLLN